MPPRSAFGKSPGPEWTTDANGTWVKKAPYEGGQSLPQQGVHAEKELRPANFEVAEDTTEPTLGATQKQTVQRKTIAYDDAKANAYDLLHRNSTFQNFKKLQGFGLKTEAEGGIVQTMGEGAKADYIQRNQDAGNLLSTAKAQARVQNQMQRNADSATTPFANGTEGGVGALSAAISGGDALTRLSRMLGSIGLQKVTKAMSVGAMPTGYYLGNVPRAATSAISISNAKNPWETQNGQK